MTPVGVIGPLRVLRAGVAGVVARLFRERREMGGARPLGERPAAGSVRVVVFSHSRPRLARPPRREKSDASAVPGGLKQRFSTGTAGGSRYVR